MIHSSQPVGSPDSSDEPVITRGFVALPHPRTLRREAVAFPFLAVRGGPTVGKRSHGGADCQRRTRDVEVTHRMAIVARDMTAGIDRCHAAGMQVIDIQKTARRLFLKSSIPDIHKGGRQCSYETTIAVKTKRKPNTYYKTPTMRVVGGWVGGSAHATAA